MTMQTDYRREKQALTDKVQKIGPAYAAAFGKMTGTEWEYLDPRKAMESTDRFDVTGFQLRETVSGVMIGLYYSAYEGKANASPVLPKRPDGTPTGRPAIWRDFSLYTELNVKIQEPNAGVSGPRFLAEVDACARRFVKHVVEPYAALMPRIAARLAEWGGGLAERDAVVKLLCEEFGGEVSRNSRGSETNTIYFRNTGLPPVDVRMGGHLYISHPSFTLDTFRAYARAVLASKES